MAERKTWQQATVVERIVYVAGMLTTVVIGIAVVAIVLGMLWRGVRAVWSW